MHARPPQTVLLIDRDAHALEMIHNAISITFGQDTHPLAVDAGSGACALEVLNGRTPSVCLVDWHLSSNPDVETCELIQALCDAYPDAPVIVMCNEPDPIAQQLAQAAGAWTWWTKGSVQGLSRLMFAAFREHAWRRDDRNRPTFREIKHRALTNSMNRHQHNIAAVAKDLGEPETTIRKWLQAV